MENNNINMLNYKYFKLWTALIITITIIYLLFIVSFEYDPPIIKNFEILQYQHPRILQNFAPPLAHFSNALLSYDVQYIL